MDVQMNNYYVVGTFASKMLQILDKISVKGYEVDDNNLYKVINGACALL